ncbi:MAG: hypothetical protein AB7O97_18860 [Planctomycetota bacterium]
MRATVPLLSTVLLTAALGAQTPNNLIGLTRTSPLINQRDHNTCTQLPSCNVPGFPPAPAVPYAGGTGWDPMRNGAVISDGFNLAEVDPDACTYICPPFPAPTLSPNAMVTGLEVVESLTQIWMLDSFGNLYQLQHGCPWPVVAVCNTGLGLVGSNATGGLAVDEKNRLAFYSYTDWATSTSTVHIAPMANPCQIFQTVTPPLCIGGAPLRGITGLAVDACRQVLYLTDGVQTIGWPYTVGGATVFFAAPTCCTLPAPAPGDQMIGLGVRSGRATRHGSPCANGACPTCPMQHVLRNSPNLGNGNFALGLDGAPLNSFVICGISAGPCMAAGPVVLPFCGPILLGGPLLLSLGPTFTPPGFGCGASATWGLPLPMDPAFCGIVLSSQCAAFCSSTFGATGTSLSNCLSWELQSN